MVAVEEEEDRQRRCASYLVAEAQARCGCRRGQARSDIKTARRGGWRRRAVELVLPFTPRATEDGNFEPVVPSVPCAVGAGEFNLIVPTAPRAAEDLEVKPVLPSAPCAVEGEFSPLVPSAPRAIEDGEDERVEPSAPCATEVDEARH